MDEQAAGIRAHLHPVRPVTFPNREGPEPRLPVQLTSFVGRQHEVAATAALLRRDSVRLVTLTGSGGVGKTRLAIRVAEEVAEDFPDGVWFVPLAPVRDPSLVSATVAQTLGLRETGTRTAEEGIRDVLRDRRALVVLDNVEHLLEAGPLIPALLAACPHLTVLVTSRAVLRLSGEHAVAVPPLSLPTRTPAPGGDRAIESEAVQLFVERAVAARSNFVLTDDDAPTIAAICAKLDGVPLAIELAAARVRSLPPSALLGKLEHQLALLTGGGRDQPPRLQSMRDAIAWSYDLLDPDEQALFRCLAVFVGGFTLAAAEAVAGDEKANVAFLVPRSSSLDLIASLVDHSLVWQEAGAGGGSDAGAPRYRMLETVREYGLEQLAASGEAEAGGQRHASYFLAVAEEAEPGLRGPAQLAWLDRLEAELPNLRAALAWLRDAGDAAHGLRLAAALWTFWIVRGRAPEGRRWLRALLAAGSEPAVRLKALLALADLANRQGEYEEATTWAEEALGLARACGDRAGEAAALRGLGSVVTSRSTVALYGLDDAALAEAEFARAEAYLERGVVLARESGDAWGVARALLWLTNARSAHGDAAGAAVPCAEATAAFRRLGDPWQLCMVTAAAGVLALTAEDLPRARTAFAESLTLARQLDYRWFAGLCLIGLAAAGGEAERAARLLGAAAVMREATGEPFRPSDQAWHDRAVAAARNALGEAEYAAAWAAGAALSPEAAIAEALALAAAPMESQDRAAQSVYGNLTPREVDVLRLVAAGRSDREIAAELAVSYRTVTNHVTSILTKLDAPSRAAAAAHAVRRGLA